MAQNVTVAGASYSDVPSVTLPKTGGGTASFTDVTDTTAEAGDVAAGEYFYTAAGVRTLGTASGGSSGGRCTYYGICSTGASTATKVVTCSGFTLETGAFLAVLFSTANYAATPKLDVNNTGEKSIYIGNSTPNSTINTLTWSANTVLYFIYDGTYWRYLGNMAAANVQRPEGGGSWYVESTTAAATATKVASYTGFTLVQGAVVAVKFSKANTVIGAIKLNVNSTGAKTIYYKNAATSASNALLWNAGATVLFVYDGSYYRYLGSDMDGGGGSYTLPTASIATKGGVKLPGDGTLYMNGDTLRMAVPICPLTYESGEPTDTYATVLEALMAGKMLVLQEMSEHGDPNDPYQVCVNIPVRDVVIQDTGDGYGSVILFYSRYEDSMGTMVTYRATVEEIGDTWTVNELSYEPSI